MFQLSITTNWLHAKLQVYYIYKLGVFCMEPFSVLQILLHVCVALSHHHETMQIAADDDVK
jgi:hypothetical protein